MVIYMLKYIHSIMTHCLYTGNFSLNGLSGEKDGLAYKYISFNIMNE